MLHSSKAVQAVVFWLAVATGGGALAEAPMVKTQAPGYHRLMLGDFEITAVSDGTFKLPVLQLLAGSSPERLQQALHKGYLGEQVETSVNAYLVNTGRKLVLIDTGAAQAFGPTLGHLQANLRAAGYAPEQVDEVYITHLHPDHVGGLLAGQARAFPNAVVRLDQADLDYWLSEAHMQAAPDAHKPSFQSAMAALKPYLAAGKVRGFSGDTELLPGIRAVTAHGHTPGHTVYQVESQGQKLMLWGDLMHVAAVQFEDPSVTIGFDSDQAQAARQRNALYAQAAQAGYLVGVAHNAFPGIGRLRAQADGAAYTWVPLNYSSQP